MSNETNPTLAEADVQADNVVLNEMFDAAKDRTEFNNWLMDGLVKPGETTLIGERRTWMTKAGAQADGTPVLPKMKEAWPARFSKDYTNEEGAFYISCGAYKKDRFIDGKATASKAFTDETLFLVFDDAKALPPLPPTWETKTSAGSSQYGYVWKDGHRATSEQHQAMYKRFGDLGWCDKGANNAVRWSRIEGSVNTKENRNNFKSRIVAWDKDTRYTPEELCAGFGFSLQDLTIEERKTKLVLSPSSAAPGTAIHWLENNWHLSAEIDGDNFSDVDCPNAGEHTDGRGTARYNRAERYAFCHHGHCKDFEGGYDAYFRAEAVKAGCPDKFGHDLEVLATALNRLQGIPEAAQTDHHREQIKAIAETITEETQKVAVPAARVVSKEAFLARAFDVGDTTDADCPPPDYIFSDYLVKSEVNLMTGHGGTGKTSSELTTGTHCAFGLPLGDLYCHHSEKVYIFSAEDRRSTVLRRLRAICEHLGRPMTDLKGRMWVNDLQGLPKHLYVQDKGVGQLTAIFRFLKEEVIRLGIGYLIIDNASVAFGGDEINRLHVSVFMESLVDFAAEHNIAITLITHISKSANSNGEIDPSGSTGWANSARLVRGIAVAPDEDGKLVIKQVKNTHGKPGIKFDWQRHEKGVYMPVNAFLTPEAAAAQEAQRKVMEEVKQHAAHQERKRVWDAFAAYIEKYPDTGVTKSLSHGTTTYRTLEAYLVKSGGMTKTAFDNIVLELDKDGYLTLRKVRIDGKETQRYFITKDMA